MIVSVNWLKKYTSIDVSIDELVKLIGSRLVEIENVTDLGRQYRGIVIAKIVECAPIEGTDHLNLTKIDDGGKTEGVSRDENGLVQVVCGAPNVREGLMVAWLPPGVTVPATINDSEPFVLGARELRGVMSNGMLASAKELDLWDDHEGILELDDNMVPGDDFGKTYELDDYLLDMENNSWTHRPDTFGVIGFAREVAAIQGNTFITPERMQRDKIQWPEKTGNQPTPKVTIDNPELSSRYQAVVLENVDSKIQLSPLEIRTYLARVGIRPHSAVVDVTNYMMMVSGQPLHAFDYDKLKAVNNGEIDIHVRSGHAGEKLVLIDEREIELSENDIVIANGETVVALAGAMGGRDTEIDDDTTNVLLESASFNLYNLRNTQMRHGIFSEAITRFTKGQPAELTAPVLAGAVDLLRLSAGAERASDIADTYPVKQEFPKVYAMAEHMNAALGTEFSTEDIVNCLKNVEFTVEANEKGVISAVPPYWRTDVKISEDLDEEVGRLNGFDSIRLQLPTRDFTAVSPDGFDQLRLQVKNILRQAGANEVLTYSFVHGDLLQKVGQNESHAYRIINSLSPDLQYYRLSLTPSLLTHIHPNRKAGYESFALFESNKVHSKEFGVEEDYTPKEHDSFALVVNAPDETGAAYYKAKRLLDYLGTSLGLTFRYTAIESRQDDTDAPFDIRRSAIVTDEKTSERIGIIGEYTSSVRKALKLTDKVAGFEIDPWSLLKALSVKSVTYVPLSKYPSTERDICFKVSSDITYASLKSVVDSALSSSDMKVSVSPIDIYQSEQQTKNITFRIVLTSLQKTLTGDEISQKIDEFTHAVTTELGATVV